MSHAKEIDLASACAVLDCWLAAHEEEALDLSTAQQSLRAVHEDMLDGWDESPEGNSQLGMRLMFGVSLVRLAEQGAWAACCQFSKGMPDRPSPSVAATVAHARRMLGVVEASRPVRAVAA